MWILLILMCAVPGLAQEPWRITLITAGGITGGGGGTELRSDGSLFKTNMVTPGDSTRTYLGKVDKAQLQTVLARLKAAEGVKLNQYANMTTRLSYQAPGSRRDYSWEKGNRDLPAPLASLVSSLQNLAPKAGGGPCWDGKENAEASADLFLAQGQAYTLTVRVGKKKLEFKGQGGVGQAGDLKGKTLGELKITAAGPWWIEGTHQGKKFRLPVWTEVAP